MINLMKKIYFYLFFDLIQIKFKYLINLMFINDLMFDKVIKNILVFGIMQRVVFEQIIDFQICGLGQGMGNQGGEWRVEEGRMVRDRELNRIFVV